MQPLTVQLDQPQFINIAVQPFPWNQIWVDGQMLAARDTRRHPFGTICSLAAGTHEIRYVWRPDSVWLWLKALSRVVLLLWFLLAAVLRFRTEKEQRESEYEPGLSPAAPSTA